MFLKDHRLHPVRSVVKIGNGTSRRNQLIACLAHGIIERSLQDFQKFL